jgi:hypothetical protein
MFRSLLFGALLCVTIPSFSQITIRLFPSHQSKDGSIPASCAAASQSFQNELAKLPQPAQWIVYIACDDQAWVDLMEHVYGQPGLNVYGLTDPNTGLTFLRGSVLVGRVHGVEPQQLVTHELAHVTLKTTSEPEADRLAQQWMRTTVATKEAR